MCKNQTIITSKDHQGGAWHDLGREQERHLAGEAGRHRQSLPGDRIDFDDFDEVVDQDKPDEDDDQLRH